MRSSRHRFAALFAGLLAPALVSCVWVLDFDELQTEKDDAKGGTAGKGGSDTGGAGGTSGTSGTGTGGSGDCPSNCFDDDPCTLDGCTTDGECTREPVTGLALDGVDETIPADTTYRVTMAAGPDAFFLSSFTSEGVNPEVSFYRLDANAPSDALEKIADLGGLNLGDTKPISAAGLAVDNALGRIHAFIGMANDNGPRLWHVVLDMNYEVVTRTAVLTGYGEQSLYNHPVVANLGGDIAATWINGSGNVSLWTGALAGPKEVAVGRGPMAVSLIATDANDPLALYGVSGGGVFVEGSSLAAVGMEECQVNPGNYLSAASVSTGIPGFWIGYWTKYGPSGTEGFLTTDARGIACVASGCASAPATDCGSAMNNLVRNVAVASALRPGDPTGVVHMIQVTPVIGTDDNGATLSAGLLANASRIDFGDVPFQGETMTTDLGSVPLAQMPTALPNLEGPDWPAVAYVPPDRVAIAWTEPAPATGSEVRIQRYRLCSPD